MGRDARLDAVREVDGWRLTAVLGGWAGKARYGDAAWISTDGARAVVASAWEDLESLQARVGWSVLELATGDEAGFGEVTLGATPVDALWCDDDGDAIYARDEAGRGYRIDLPDGALSPATLATPDPSPAAWRLAFGATRPEAEEWLAVDASGRHALVRGSLGRKRGLPWGVSLATVARFDLARGEAAWRHEGHAGPIEHLAFDRQGARLVSASPDRTARVWDLRDGACAWSFDLDPLVFPAALRITDDGRGLALWNGFDQLARWSLVDGIEAPSVQLRGRAIPPAFALSPDQDLLAVIDASTEFAWLWDLRGERPTRARVDLPWIIRVRDLAFAHDREALRVLGDDGETLHVATLDLRRRPRSTALRLPPAPSSTATGVTADGPAMLDDSASRALVRGARGLTWIDARTGVPRGVVAEGAGPDLLALAAGGFARATQTRVDVWDDDGRTVLRLDLSCLRDEVTAVALSPDATRLAVGTALGVALVWSRG